MPDSVISSSQITNKAPAFFFALKKILNVLRKQNDLIYGKLSVLKYSLFLWEQGVVYWFDTIVDQSFEDIVKDAKM